MNKNKLSFQEYMIGVLNVEQKCRVCLRRGHLRTIYSNYYGNVKIIDMLIKLNCIVESTTSQQICPTCLQKVIHAYELTIRFDESTEYFKSLTPYFNENFNNGNNYFFDSLKRKSAHRKTITELLKQFCCNSDQSKKQNKNAKDYSIDLKSIGAPNQFDMNNFEVFLLNKTNLHLDNNAGQNGKKKDDKNNFGNGLNSGLHNNLESIQPEPLLNDNNKPQFIVSILPSQTGNEPKYTVDLHGQTNNNEETSCLKQTSCGINVPELTRNEPHIVVDNINIQKPTKSNKSPNKKITSGKNYSPKSLASCSSFPDFYGNKKILEDKNIKPKKKRGRPRKFSYDQISLKPATCMNSLPDLSGNEESPNIKDKINIQKPKNSAEDTNKNCTYVENSNLNSLPDLSGNEVSSNIKDKINIQKPKNADEDTNKNCTYVENYNFDLINLHPNSLPPFDDFTGNEEICNLENKNNQKEKNNNSTYGENCYNLVTSYLNSPSQYDFTENAVTYNLEVENIIQKPQNLDQDSINNLESLFDLCDLNTDKLGYTANSDNTLDNKNNSNHSEILANKENESNSNVEPITFETERFPGCVVDQNMNDILHATNSCQSVINEIIHPPEDDKNQKKNNLGDKDSSSTVTSLGSTEKALNKDNVYNPVVEKPKRKIETRNSKTSANSCNNENINIGQPSQKIQTRKRKLPARIPSEIDDIKSCRRAKLPKSHSEKPEKKETKRITVNGKNVIKIKPSLKPAVNVEVMSKTQKLKKTPAKQENNIKPAVKVKMSKTQKLTEIPTKKKNSIKPAVNAKVMSKTKKLKKTYAKKENSIKKCKVDITIEKNDLDDILEKNSVTCSKGCVNKKNKKCQIITKAQNKDLENPDKKSVFNVSKTIDMNKLITSTLAEEKKNKNLEKKRSKAHDCAKTIARYKRKLREVDLKNNKGTLIVTPEAIEDLLKNALNKSELTPTDFENTTGFVKSMVFVCTNCKKLCLTEHILQAHKCVQEE